jgi:tRNA threonylcarbamoyladenosine biosynthesis protein TsaE
LGATVDFTRSTDGLTIQLASEEETCRLGRALADVIEPGVVIGLIGPLGAGKTRLVRAMAESLDVDPGAISSPTFVLIHEYEGRLPVYHFDAYRLNSPAAFEDLGAADYWDGGGVCLVEWADRVLNLLPESRWIITLTLTGPTSRSAKIELPPSAQAVAERLAKALGCRGSP